MININEFVGASFEKKCELISTSSNYLTTRNEKDDKVYLYYVGDFFIEVYYSPNKRKVRNIIAFKDYEKLELYADAVSLAELME